MTRARKQPPIPKPGQLDLFDQRTRPPAAQSARAAALAAEAAARTKALRSLNSKARGVSHERDQNSARVVGSQGGCVAGDVSAEQWTSHLADPESCPVVRTDADWRAHYAQWREGKSI